MSAEAPIDVDEYEYDELKLENEDLYGEQIKTETMARSDFPEPETFFKSGKKTSCRMQTCKQETSGRCGYRRQSAGCSC